MSITPKTTTSHTRETFAHIDQADLERLLSEAVAKQVGIDLAAPGVRSRTVITSRDSSTGIVRYAEVRITEDLDVQRPNKDADKYREICISGPITQGSVIAWWEGGERYEGEVYSAGSPPELWVRDRATTHPGRVAVTLVAVLDVADPNSVRIIA